MDLNKILQELEKYFGKSDNNHDNNDNHNNNKVIEWLNPEKLVEKCHLNLNTTKNDEDVINMFKKVIQYSVKTNHKMFFNQLFASTNKYTSLSELVVTILNPSMYTYEMAPVFTMMEKILFDRILELFSYQGGDIHIMPGGSMSNVLAIHMARYNFEPKIKEEGIFGFLNRCKIYVSQDSHYSFLKGAMFIGFGKKHIVKIKSNSGRMDINLLEDRILTDIKNNYVPLMIVGTVGTTVLGSIDNIGKMGQIANKYKIWFHVDAAWGGALIFSSTLKKKLDGIELSDSLTWNPHKMMGTPLQCSLLMIRNKKVSESCNVIEKKESEYLFQTDKFYDKTFDTGKKYLLCGRRVDILKLWTLWKTKGEEQFGKDIDKIHMLGDYFMNLIRESDCFDLVMEESRDTTNVCFIPKCENKDINMCAKIKEMMVKEGSMMISYQPLTQYNVLNCFRIVFINPNLRKKDLHNVINLLEAYYNEFTK